MQVIQLPRFGMGNKPFVLVPKESQLYTGQSKAAGRLQIFDLKIIWTHSVVS